MDNSEIKSKFLEQGKLIVMGLALAKKTTESELRKHFQKYGEVSEAIVYGKRITASRRKNKKRGRKYNLKGFVVFSHPKDIMNVPAEDHIIDDRHVKIEWADKLKIFVEGMPYFISEKAVTKCFKDCGKITNIQFERWNCVITFTRKEAVEQAVNLTPILLKGKLVNVKQAPELSDGAAAVARPLPPRRNWLLREFETDDLAEHVSRALADLARAPEHDVNDEYNEADDDGYSTLEDRSILKLLKDWNEVLDLENWD